MLTEVLNHVNAPVMTGLMQAAVAVVMVAAVVILCRCSSVRVEREAAVAIARGFAQMLTVGMVLALLLNGHLSVGLLILMLMMGAAAATVSRRTPGIRFSFLICFLAIGVGSGTVIAAMLITGMLQTSIAMLVPVGSMIIANSMNACAQASERFRADVTAQVGRIEAGLALGADPAVTVAPYVRSGVYASLLPRLDML